MADGLSWNEMVVRQEMILQGLFEFCGARKVAKWVCWQSSLIRASCVRNASAGAIKAEKPRKLAPQAVDFYHISQPGNADRVFSHDNLVDQKFLKDHPQLTAQSPRSMLKPIKTSFKLISPCHALFN